MAKKTKKDSQKQEDKPKLTEWQKRNLDFLQRKEKKKEQQDKLKKELVEQKRARLKSKEDEDKEDKQDSQKKGSKKQDDKKQDKSPEDKPKKPAAPKLFPKKKKPKKNPRETKFKRRLLTILLPALVGILLSLYLLTPLSKYKRIQVQGVQQTSEQNVLAASRLSDQAYTISTIFNRSKLARSVEKNDPYVKSAQVSYHFPFTFTFKIKEYKIVAYAQTDQGYEPILESGQRMDSVAATDLPANFTTINLGNGKYLSSLIKKLTKMKPELISEIKVISLANSKTTPDLLNLEMQDGHMVRVPLSEIDKKLPYYDKIKDKLKDNQIVDMEVGIYATNDQEEAKQDQADSEEANSEQAPAADNPENSGENPEASASEQGSQEAQAQDPNNPAEAPQESNPEADPAAQNQ